MKVLVTGGAGYIGSHTVRALKQAGFTPVVLDSLVYGHRDFVDPASLVVGDLQDRPFLDQLFQQHQFVGVVHFAAFTYVGESVQQPLKYYRNNVASTLNLIEAMTQAGVGNIIFSSTCATYGEPQFLPLTEDHPQNPINPYGMGKLMVERILQDTQRAMGLQYIALRYFNAAGADPAGGIGEDHNPETHLIPLVLDVALGRRPHITVFGTDYPTPDGTCVRDYIHVNDLAQAHVLGLQYLLAGGKSLCLNLGNGNGFSVQEVITTTEAVTGRKIPVEFGTRRAGDPAVLVGSSERIRSLLKWSPEYDALEVIIQTAWTWHQARFS
ncbi:UDP-glucose 4-epimerase GalE [Candidatus Cyanaurora vandensis]|uniref:UDP-glucose 4-epimerase GalE n=1 Tax=Candidatus Cyanaurora vandensis TaxID=2714958 RepID=UPI002579F0CC|nr:UDP-glucose 4-epimerase GalE [Candidatus Cyanaurora vandensis]